MLSCWEEYEGRQRRPLAREPDEDVACSVGRDEEHDDDADISAVPKAAPEQHLGHPSSSDFAAAPVEDTVETSDEQNDAEVGDEEEAGSVADKDGLASTAQDTAPTEPTAGNSSTLQALDNISEAQCVRSDSVRSSWWWSWKWNWKVALVLLALVAVIIGVVVVLLVVVTKDESAGDSSPATTANDGPDDNDLYFGSLRSVLVPPPLWPDTNSPQIKAVEWMAYTDTSVRFAMDDSRLVQRYVLLVLFFATGGEEWDAFWNIAPGTHECHWSFVSCRDGHSVTDFRVGSGVDMSGALPSEIGLLSELVLLDLKDNRLKGPLPEQLFQLKHLVTLSLSNNLFSSTLSSQLGNLQSLETLHLDGNFFTGALGEPMRALTALTSLQVHDTPFSGPIFDDILQLTNLEAFNIGNTELTGIFSSEISKLSRLRTIIIENSPISGQLPPDIGTLPLVRLKIQFTNMDGSIPDFLGQSTSTLKILMLIGSDFGPTIPTTLGLLKAVETIHLGSNELEGTIPTELGRMSTVKEILLMSNRLTGTVPSELGLCTKLERLYLHDNRISGTIPSEILELPILFELD